MRFALLGDHPDGLDMARALVESGRHQLLVYSGPAVGSEYLRRWNLTPRCVHELEEVLADPNIEAVIVAGRLAERPAQLRRALQSERHVLCVHPADQTADLAYEAAMLQADTRQILFPLLPEAFHPGILNLAKMIRDQESQGRPSSDAKGETQDPVYQGRSGPRHSMSPLRLLEWQRWSSEQVLLETESPRLKPGFPGWDVLRLLGGEIVEVMALAGQEEVEPDEPILLAGRFDRGGLFQVHLLPHQPETRWRLTVILNQGRAELEFPQGWPGPARLAWSDGTGEEKIKTWEAWNPWPAVVEAFEIALDAHALARLGGSGQESMFRGWLTWQDEVRCLELDGAARRSVERRRASTLEFQEATEEASFKGTMTLVGCSLLWISLILLILSVWLPWLGWLILPVFGLFLFMQLLRWVVPPVVPTPPKGPMPGSQPEFPVGNAVPPVETHITSVKEHPRPPEKPG